jgi:hypothetical protein
VINNIHGPSGRHIIVPGEEVLGGVLLTRAAIAVDIDECPAPYEYAFRTADSEMTDRQRESALHIGSVVNDIVRGIVPFSKKLTVDILRTEAQSRGIDRLDQSHTIGLSGFIFKGGICHQQTLLVAAVLRLFQERRGIGGLVSVEHAKITEGRPDRHVWATLVREDEKVAIDSSSDRVVLFD